MAATLDIDTLSGEVREAILRNEDGRSADAAKRFSALQRQISRSGDGRREVLEQQARVLLGLSSSRLDIDGRIDDALALLAEAEGTAGRAGAGHLLAAIRGQQGLLLLRLGETTSALRALDSAAELFDAAKPYDQITILLNRGVLHLELGSLQPAYDDLVRSAAIAEAAGDKQLEFKARHNLGYVDFLAGNLPRALAAMARAAADKPGDPHPVALLDRARVLREGGLVRDADTLLTEAGALFSQGKMLQDLGETELVRAECALVEGDPTRAGRLARAALRRFTKRENVRWQRKAELLVVQAARSLAADTTNSRHRRALAKVAARAEELARACSAEGRSDLARRAGLIEAEARLAAQPESFQVGDLVARPRLMRGDSVSTRLQTREVRARLALAAGDIAGSAREVHRGLAELGSYQSRFGSLDLRTASAIHGVALAGLDLDLALRRGRVSDVFASVERTRAVSTRLASVRPPSDPETARLLAELRQNEEEIRLVEGDPEAADTLVRLRARSADLQRSVRARAWEREGSASVAGSIVGIGELRTSLRDEDAAFVSYVQHRSDWLAVLVTGRRAKVVPLVAAGEVDELVRRVRADLDALAMPRLPDPLRKAVDLSLEIGLARLDETLLAPLRVEGMPLVVSPSGPLMVLPWSLLPSRRGLPLVLASSASAWMKARAGSRSGRAPKVSVVAGPGLNRAGAEASRVHRTWAGSSLLSGDQATTSRVSDALAEADVVHIAAHGTHQQDSPLFSSVRLADGPLYAYELDADAGIAGCVVLSACEAGLSTVGPGDEGLGLTSVLLHLGAHSVLAGVARVRDDIAAELMETVHHSMERGADSASALAAAQADCAAPAPFVCFGSTWRN